MSPTEGQVHVANETDAKEYKGTHILAYDRTADRGRQIEVNAAIWHQNSAANTFDGFGDRHRSHETGSVGVDDSVNGHERSKIGRIMSEPGRNRKRS